MMPSLTIAISRRQDHPPVPVVGDPPAVVDVATRFTSTWYGTSSYFAEVGLELQHAALEVACCELVAGC